MSEKDYHCNLLQNSVILGASKTPCIDRAVSEIKKSLPKKFTREDIGRAIFNYVRGHVIYPQMIYYNTRYGAEGTLKGGVGNCCDQARLNVALCQRLGVPAKFHYSKRVRFLNGHIYGHAWAVMTLEDGTDVTLDTSTKSSRYGDNKWKILSTEYVSNILPW